MDIDPAKKSRRRFLITVCQAMGASAAFSVLSACAAPAAAPTSAPAAAPTTAPAAAPTAPPAAKPTTAPAAPTIAPTTAPAAAPTTAPTAATASTKTVNVGISTTVTSWDPTDQVNIEQLGFQLLVNEPLVYYKDAQFNLDPRLATAWQPATAENPTTWNFKLRQGVKFHDGTPFNAQAVDISWKRVLNPDPNDEQGVEAQGRLGKAFDSLDIVDDYTINVHTKGTYPDFLDEVTRVTAAMVSPGHTKDLPMAQASRSPVGTGPFKFDNWNNPDTVVFAANPDYWGQKATVAGINLRTIPDGGARIAALEAGDIDIAFKISADDMKRLSSDSRYTTKNFTTLETYFLDMLQSKKPFSDVRVRQALNYAIDKNAIVQQLYLGFAKVTDSPLFPGIAFRKTFPVYEYDPARAKQLLSDAGYPNGFECQLWYVAYDPQLKAAIQVISDQFAQIGVKTTLRQFESSSYIPNLTAHTDERDLFITDRSITGTDANLTRLWTKAEWDDDNRGRFYNQQYEDLINQARTLLDSNQRAALYAQAQQILWEQAAEVYLWGKDLLVAARSNIAGFDVFPDASIHMEHVTKA